MWSQLRWKFVLIFQSLGLPCKNVGDIDFLYPVARSDIHVAFSNIRHLLSSASSSPWITLFIKSSVK